MLFSLFIFILRNQKFLSKRLRLLFKHCRLNWCVYHIERIQQMLQIRFIDVIEEVLNALIVAIVVDHDEANLAGGDKG